MRLIGLILITAGLAVLAYVAFRHFSQSQEIVSPVPESGGVKVIYITPGASE